DSNAGEMTTGGMAADIEASGIAAKACGVLVDPGDTAADLIGHHAQVAARRVDMDEVQDDIVDTGIDEEIGGIGEVFGCAEQPSSAMNKDEDRRVRRARRKDVKALDRRRAIGKSLGRAEPLARRLAVRGDALRILAARRCV